MAFYDTVRGWFGRFGALSERQGTQNPLPSSALVPDTQAIGPDGALQLATVWACVERRATTLASLPLFVYERRPGQAHKDLARSTRLFGVLHDSPNARMTPFEFWRAMLMNHDLRGNAYARIERDEATGEALSMWPMPADQVQPIVLADGAMVYAYQADADVAVYAEENVLHLKGLGNGTVGLAKLEFMRATTHEAAAAQTSATKTFGNGGKPTGVLMIDRVLNAEQRAAVKQNFADMALGSASRLFVLEADMKYQQLSLSPEDQQILETRRFSVEEICRWFDVPPVLVHHSNVTTWGSGVEQIVAGFHKFTVRPMVVSIEQAVSKRVLTARQRATLSVEFSIDALLRGSPTERAQFYATGLQNGYITRNEVRQLENLPPDTSPQANQLTAQTNLLPLAQLGKEAAAPAPAAAPQSLSAAVLQALATKAAAPDETAERRHREVLQVLQAQATKPAQPAVDFGNAVINVTRTETIAAPAVHMHVPQQPAPVVHMHVPEAKEALPPQVVVHNTVQPATVDMQVELLMPPRQTESTVERDDNGDIVRTVTIERDV